MDKEKNMWMRNKNKQITNINFEFWIIDFTIQYLSKQNKHSFYSGLLKVLWAHNFLELQNIKLVVAFMLN